MGTQDNINAFWSMVAPGYEAHPGNVVPVESAEYGKWVATVRDALPAPPADVLDVATGTGFLARIAASVGHRVVGIDLSEQMLAEARESGPRAADLELEFRLGDAVAPDFAPASFDAVTNRHLLWTLREPRTAIASWRALLRPGGRIVAIDGFWFRDSVSEDDAESEPGPFERYYTPDTRAALPVMQLDDAAAVAALFEAVGFAEVRAVDLTTLPNHDAGGEIPYMIIAEV